MLKSIADFPINDHSIVEGYESLSRGSPIRRAQATGSAPSCAYIPPETFRRAYADGDELYLDRRRGDLVLHCFDIGLKVNRLHAMEMVEAAGFAPGGEVGGSLRVGFPGIGVPDIGGEEFIHTLCGFLGRPQRGRGG